MVDQTKNSIEMLTFREQTVTLSPSTRTPIYFDDTKPNHMIFQNLTDHDIYVGRSHLVSSSNFELLVPSNGQRMYALPMGLKEIYVYSSCLDSCKIKINSFEGTFSAQSIQQTQETVSLGLFSGHVDVDSMPALPTGNNVIGKVGINQPLPAGTNNIGVVTLDTIPDNKAIPTRSAGMTNLVTNSVTVTTGQVELKAAAQPLANRTQMILYAPDAGTIYWGNNGVTSATGLPLNMGDAPVIFDFDPNNYLGIFAVSDGTDRTVKVGESA